MSFLDPILEDIGRLFVPSLFNLYFAAASLSLGFVLALGLALVRNGRGRVWPRLAGIYIYFFRGSPLFIQFFMVYSLMLSFNLSVWQPMGWSGLVLHPLFIGPLVLTLNTTAYTAEIFSGALRTVPRGELEAARAFGMGRWQQFRSVMWPNMIRIAWPAYTNEVVFLFQATALVYFTLPVISGQEDLMNRADGLFQRDFNVFLHYSVAALYFLVLSLCLFAAFGAVYRRMMRHALPEAPRRIRFAPKFLR